MKWRSWLLVGVLASGLAVGCGSEDDEPSDVNQENQNNQNNQNNHNNDNNSNNDNNGNQNNDTNNNQNNNNGEDEFAETVDVWVGAQIGNEDNPTHLDIGESFGGRFENEGAHHFSVDLTAGELLAVSVDALEEGLETNRDEFIVSLSEPVEEDAFFGSPDRYYVTAHSDQREFFVSESGTYTINVNAPGGDEMGFALRSETRDVDAGDDLELPGTTEGKDANDGLIDAYEVSVTEATSVDLEIFALRAPVSSSLDSWVYIYDVDAGELRAENESQSEDVYDSRVVFDMEADTTYWVIVDAFANHSDASYQVVTEFIATSPSSPFELSLAGNSEFSGTILQRDAAAYTDHFTVDIEPGEYKKVTVEGHDQLDPIMQVSDTSTPSGAVSALAVDNIAGATLGLSEDAEEGTTFQIELTDQRNLGGEVESYFGGADFDYTIELESVTLDPGTLEPGDDTQLSVDTPGDIEVFDITVSEDHILWLDSGSDTDIETEQPLADMGFLQSWALATTTTLATPHLFDGYYWGMGESLRFIFRDYLFRGGPEYSTDARIRAFDVNAPDYGATDLDSDNDTVDNAASMTLPTLIAGEFVDDAASGGDPEESDGPQAHYFSFYAEAGDFLVVATDNGPVMETHLSVIDDNGDELTRGALFMEQFQEMEDTQFYDGAMVFEAEAEGDYVLAIEQYCDPQGFFGCDYGDVSVRVFVD